MAIVYEQKIRCGKCHGRHRYPIQVQACYGVLGDVWPCSWQLEVLLPTGDPDEPYYEGVAECGAPSRMREDGTGYDCEAGHEHTFAEARQRAGWDYAEDADEARQLMKYGTEPRDLVTGGAFAW
jgi:hypothetical protein